MKTMPAIANLIARGAVLIAGIALAIILLLIGGQIASRIFTGESLSWSDELARLFFIYLVFNTMFRKVVDKFIAYRLLEKYVFQHGN